MAQMAAFAQTAALAAKAQPLDDTILAASGFAGSRGRTQDPAAAALRKAADTACFVDNDPSQCSILNQQLASYQASATCPNGPVTASLHEVKRQGSIQDWFHNPVRVSPVKPVTDEVASLAVTMGVMGSK